MYRVYEVIDFGNHDSSDGFPSPRSLYRTEDYDTAYFIKNVLKKNYPKMDFGFEVIEIPLQLNLELADEREICRWYQDEFLNKE